MALNMKTLTQALAKASAVIEKTVQTTVQEVTGPKPLQDYDLLDQLGSGGPGLAWRLYAAKPRGSAPAGQYPVVCVWVLDKRALAEARTRAGISKASEDAFLDIVRADAARLVRLRHPGVVHVLQGLDETKTAMAMVTEPLFASVANALGVVDNVVKVPKELKGMEMGLLEVKHGLLQVAETIEFLHNNARLVHRSICPETVFITFSGAWKLGGFGFAISAEQASNDSNVTQPFHYSEYDVEDSALPLQPSLDYTAPELVRNKLSGAGGASDIFSFACLAYHLVARKPLLECHNNVKMYMNRLSYLSHEVFADIPPELVPDLQRMLSMDESSRPTAMGFTGSPFFRDDTRLRALRFLDHMLERDNMQKTEFLKALADMWKDFDSRVLRYKVLPPLCAELRNMVMQPMILPMVLTIADSQDKNDFEISTLPALVPVLSSAAGETLLLLVKHAELIINKTSQDQLVSYVLPLLVRAYNDNDVRIQEEVLRRTVTLAKQLDSQLVKQAILPRVHGLALKTTVAAVRVNALLCLGDLVHSLDKQSVLDILETLQRCTAVDRSAPTLMCTLGVAQSILKQYGIDYTAEHVLPLLFPLLMAPQLNVQQFAKYMLFVKHILRKIEEKRGVTLTDAGTPEMKVAPSVVNGFHSEPQGTSVPSLVKKSTSWDEDWGTPVKTQLTAQLSNPSLSIQSISISQSTPVMSSQMPSSSQTTPQNTLSCPAVDIEWPPRSTSTVLGQNSGGDNANSKELADSSSDDFDPFANWPPRPSNLYGSMIPTSTVISSTLNVGNSSSTAINQSGLRSIGLSKQGMPMSNIGSLNANGSIGFLKANQFNAEIGNGNSFGFSSDKRASDIGSIFASAKSENSMPKLAPPPPTAIGRGRGRTSLSAASRPSHKAPSEQPPLLDLL